jgi:hypothetical protein
MNDIETQLATLKPAGQSELARKILEIPHRRRQRRRDLFVGLTGLLTGIAATVLVMLSLQTADGVRQTADGRRQTAANDLAGTPVLETAVLETVDVKERHSRVGGNLDERRYSLDSRFRGNDREGWNDREPDIDAWIARYEILLRHRPTLAYQPVVYAPVSMPGGVSPLEYRNKLLEGYTM